jgi:putative ABC transport system permease protein
MLLPLTPDGDSVTFALSTTSERRDRVLQRAIAVLGNRNPMRILDNPKSFDQLRAEYFQREESMVTLLLVAGLALLTVTAAGIMGLATFWVRQRTRAIGIRRALGATRGDILQYFLVENFLIITGGILLGCVLALVLNWALVTYYEVQMLPVRYLATGALALWITGLVAGLSPALRAASVPPAVATRSIS